MASEQPTCAALIVAGGSGGRFGGDLPKQYAPLAGRPLLGWTLRAFAEHPEVDAVRAVIRPRDRELYAAAAGDLGLLEPVEGGATRQASVRNGLESLAGLAPAKILIHDAARPFVSASLISRILAALAERPAAIPALPVTDTLKRARPDGTAEVAATVDRVGLWRAQTPQGFRFAAILDAHRRLAADELTDDAAVAERSGLAVALVPGEEDNMKITMADDLRRAERWLVADREVRTGFGFDVHRFAPGDRIVLCGVEIPFAASLAGHSDADVGLHALTDALLGAIAAGDIGSHFPPNDPRWQGAASEIFLRRAGELVAAAGGHIANLDVTLVCERPRIAPHRPAMVERIAAILAIDPGQVSVKATTTERLGFTGRGEGIAAQAVATVHLTKV
jgi:2-C-methyl-D-erythritol 4-phosphate cytidylyltransferase/2-C-methyl-D-erythritol 2,4-cyclodiphosphate synthase